MTQAALPITVPQHARTRKPRLGFVGVGWIGWHRMKALAESGRVDVCAIVEPQREFARRAHALAPAAEIVSSLRQLVSSDIDGVMIATPSALHSEQTVMALEHGRAVFCQKPLGRNQEETRRAIDRARSANRLLKVDLCYRHLAGIRAIRALVQGGELGNVFSIELAFHNAYGPDKPWFYDPKLSGGGCLIDLGIHLVDLALWLLDFPPVERVSGRLFAKGRPCAGRDVDIEDFACATVGLRTGATVNLACSWNAHAGRDAVIEVAVYGTKGGARLRNVDGSFYDFVAESCVGTSRKILAGPPDDWGGRAAMEWLDQLCAENGNRFDPSIAHLSSVAEVLDRIYDA
jgi:predicted dehydrogenase